MHLAYTKALSAACSIELFLYYTNMASSRPFSLSISVDDLEAAKELDSQGLSPSDSQLSQVLSSLSKYAFSPEDLLRMCPSYQTRPVSAVLHRALDITTGLETVDDRLLLCSDERQLALHCLENCELSQRALAYSNALKRIYDRTLRREIPIAAYREKELLSDLETLLLKDRGNIVLTDYKAQLTKSCQNASEAENILLEALREAGVGKQEMRELLEGWGALRLSDYPPEQSRPCVRIDPFRTPLAEVKAFLWLSRVRGSYEEDGFNRRVFPLPIATILSSKGDQDYRDCLLRAAFPEFLIYLELSAFISQEDKSELLQKYFTLHAVSLNDYIADLLSFNKPVLLSVFTYSQDSPRTDSRFKRIDKVAEASTKLFSISSNLLVRGLTEFLNDREMQVCFVYVYEPEELKAAQQAAEFSMKNSIETRGKIVCLLVQCESREVLEWSDRWMHCAYDEPSTGFHIPESFDFPNLCLEEKVKSFLHSYFYYRSNSKAISEEECKQILTSPTLLQALIAKFVQLVSRYGLADWRHMLLVRPPLRNRPFFDTLKAAYEETGYEVFVQIVRAIEHLHAFPSYFTNEVPPVTQTLWKHALLDLDLSKLPQEQTVGWKLKMPFTMLDYRRLREGYDLEPTTYCQRFLGESLIGRFADQLQNFRQLQDLYIEDLTALSLGSSCVDPDYSLIVMNALVGSSSQQFSERITAFANKERILKWFCEKCGENEFLMDFQISLRNALSKSPPANHQSIVIAYNKELEQQMISKRNKYLYVLKQDSLVAFNCLILKPEKKIYLRESIEELENCTGLLLESGLLLLTGGFIRSSVGNISSNRSITVSLLGYVQHTGQLVQSRYAHGAIEALGQVFVFGGQEKQKLASAERLTETGWQQCGEMYSPRRNFIPCFWAKLVYIVAGYQNGIETFDPTTLVFNMLDIETPSVPSVAIARGENDLLVIYNRTMCLYHLVENGVVPISEAKNHNLDVVLSICSPVIFPAVGQVFMMENETKVSWINWNTGVSGNTRVL